MSMRCQFPLLAAFSLFFALSAVRATTLARLSLDQMAGAAEGVARVRCEATESRWENGSIWTLTIFEIVQSMKGDLPPRIVVRLPGGKVGPFTSTVEGAPRFSRGEETIVFLERSRAGEYTVSGWGEGTFRIALDTHSHHELITQDSSGMPLFDAGTRTFRAEGIRKMPIELFRGRLDAAITRAQEKTR